MSKSHLSLNDIFPRLREAVTGRRDNVVHLHPPEAEPLIDDLLDDLDRAKIALLEHVDAIPALRDAVRQAQQRVLAALAERNTGIDMQIIHLPSIDLETLTMQEKPPPIAGDEP